MSVRKPARRFSLAKAGRKRAGGEEEEEEGSEWQEVRFTEEVWQRPWFSSSTRSCKKKRKREKGERLVVALPSDRDEDLTPGGQQALVKVKCAPPLRGRHR